MKKTVLLLSLVLLAVAAQAHHREGQLFEPDMNAEVRTQLDDQLLEERTSSAGVDIVMSA